MNSLELRALDIRRAAVAREHMFNIEGLAMIVAPSPDLLAASLAAAEREPEPKAKSHRANPKPQGRRELRTVTLDQILAGV